jgi:hypothetical protein
MPYDRRPAMPQVTTVDDQFGTHRLVGRREAGVGAWKIRCTTWSGSPVGEGLGESLAYHQCCGSGEYRSDGACD